MACARNGDAIWHVHVCADLLGACLALAGQPDGHLYVYGPGEGGAWRDYLSGGPAPIEGVGMSRCAVPIVPKVARDAEASPRTVRRCILRTLRERGGIGNDVYEFHGVKSGHEAQLGRRPRRTA